MNRLAVVLALTAACATPQVDPCRMRAAGLSFDEAKEVVATFEQRQIEKGAADPLRTPKSLDDAREILKRDQLDLFGGGVAFLEKEQGNEALALRGQLLIAWGEAQLTLAQILADISARQQELVRHLELKGNLNDTEQKNLELMRAQLAEARGVSDALSRLAAEHVAEGARHAKAVIAASPNDYVGYRISADFYRLREDWPRYDAAVAKLEELKPDSNGLVFLKGASALARDGNALEAVKWLEKALDKDPKFLRARALLLLSETSLREKHVALGHLRDANPNHQIVVWAGPSIESAYAARIAQDETDTDAAMRRASPALKTP